VHDTYGAELERLLAAASSAGYEIGGERLKTSPRGFDKDHPRIEMLRHKSLTLGHSLGFEPVIHTPELLDLVRDDWRAVSATVDWIARHAIA
jgi:uncharacterized protein (DUF2461 family)